MAEARPDARPTAGNPSETGLRRASIALERLCRASPFFSRVVSADKDALQVAQKPHQEPQGKRKGAETSRSWCLCSRLDRIESTTVQQLFFSGGPMSVIIRMGSKSLFSSRRCPRMHPFLQLVPLDSSRCIA